jgi:VanZ family protein
MKATDILGKLDRLLLTVYLVAMFVLLLFRIDIPDVRVMGIHSDKLGHVALFGGLALLLRWNLADKNYANLASIAIAFVIAVAVEGAQSLTSYRSPEWWDIVAGVVGAILGAITMSRIMVFPAPEKLVGLLVAVLGLAMTAATLAADIIGLGDKGGFGPDQLAVSILGLFIAAGGAVVFKKGLPDHS